MIAVLIECPAGYVCNFHPYDPTITYALIGLAAFALLALVWLAHRS